MNAVPQLGQSQLGIEGYKDSLTTSKASQL